MYPLGVCWENWRGKCSVWRISMPLLRARVCSPPKQRLLLQAGLFCSLSMAYNFSFGLVFCFLFCYLGNCGSRRVIEARSWWSRLLSSGLLDSRGDRYNRTSNSAMYTVYISPSGVSTKTIIGSIVGKWESDLYCEFHAGIKQSRIHPPCVLPFSHPLFADSQTENVLNKRFSRSALGIPHAQSIVSENRPGAPFHVPRHRFPVWREPLINNLGEHTCCVHVQRIS